MFKDTLDFKCTLTCRIEFGGLWGVCVFHFCKLDENLWLFSNAILLPRSVAMCDASGWKLTCLTEGCISQKGRKGDIQRQGRAFFIHHGITAPWHHGSLAPWRPGILARLAMSHNIHICCMHCKRIFGASKQQQQFRRKRIYSADPTPTHKTGQVLGSLLVFSILPGLFL